MQQINEKLIKISSKSIEQSTLTRLLIGKTIYLTNDYEARWLARKHCNLTIRKLDLNFLSLNLVNSNVYKRIENEQKLKITNLDDNQLLQTDISTRINYQSNFFSSLRANNFYQAFLNEQHQTERTDLNQKRMLKQQSAYEFESGDLVQYFGLTFPRHSPYLRLFEEKIITFKESNLIANLLYKWSRSFTCDTLSNSNLYSSLNDDLNDELNLHNSRLAIDYELDNMNKLNRKTFEPESVLDEEKRKDSMQVAEHSLHNSVQRNQLDNIMPVDGDLNAIDISSTSGNKIIKTSKTNMAKYKKTENNVKTNRYHSTKKTDQFYCETENETITSTDNWFNRLFKQIKANSLLSIKYPSLNRIFYLFALALSFSCLLVLVELFIAIVTNNKLKEKGINENDNKNEREKTFNKTTLERTNCKLSTNLDISNLEQELATIDENNPLVTVDLSNLATNNLIDGNFGQHHKTNRPIITTIETTSSFLAQQQQQQIDQSSSLFNDHFHNGNLFISNISNDSNCSENYSFIHPTASAVEFADYQVSPFILFLSFQSCTNLLLNFSPLSLDQLSAA